MKALNKILDKLSGGNTLYFPGCLTKFALPEKAKQYEEILRFIGMSPILIKDYEVCCGSPPRMAGYAEDFKNLRKRNLENFEKFSIKRIVSNCPTCVSVFKNQYKFANARHITEVVWENIDKFASKKLREPKTIHYHDPCHLGRYLGIYDEPRAVLKYLGFEVAESGCNREKSVCCGAGGGMKTNNPDLANAVAKKSLAGIDADYFVSPCPMCYAHFKENAPERPKVVEFSDILLGKI